MTISYTRYTIPCDVSFVLFITIYLGHGSLQPHTFYLFSLLLRQSFVGAGRPSYHVHFSSYFMELIPYTVSRIRNNAFFSCNKKGSVIDPVKGRNSGTAIKCNNLYEIYFSLHIFSYRQDFYNAPRLSLNTGKMALLFTNFSLMFYI